MPQSCAHSGRGDYWGGPRSPGCAVACRGLPSGAPPGRPMFRRHRACATCGSVPPSTAGGANQLTRGQHANLRVAVGSARGGTRALRVVAARRQRQAGRSRSLVTPLCGVTDLPAAPRSVPRRRPVCPRRCGWGCEAGASRARTFPSTASLELGNEEKPHPTGLGRPTSPSAIALEGRKNAPRAGEDWWGEEKEMEAAPGFEPGNKGFAGLCLTTWLCRLGWECPAV